MDQCCDKMDEVKAVADILQDALKKVQTVAGSTTTSSVSTLAPTGSSVQNSAASPSFGHNISNTPRSTAQNININPSPPTINNQLASQQLLNKAQANFR